MWHKLNEGCIVVIVCLAIVDVAALAFLLSPAIRSGKRTQAELQALRAQLVQKRVQAVPALDMDKKLAEARTQIADFYAHDFAGPLFGDLRDPGQGSQ